MGHHLLKTAQVSRTIMSNKIAIALFAMLAVAAASPNKIHSVQVYTSDCFQCGMSVLGKISLEVTGYGGRICNTGILDNVGHDDYNRGTISTFSGSTIGQCNNFDLTSLTSSHDIHMKITHTGTDGGKFDWVQVFTDGGHYECMFSAKLDHGDSETGHGCQYYRK